MSEYITDGTESLSERKDNPPFSKEPINTKEWGCFAWNERCLDFHDCYLFSVKEKLLTKYPQPLTPGLTKLLKTEANILG